MKKISLLFILLFSLSFFPKITEAKVLPQALKGGGTSVRNYISSGITVYPRIRSDRRALIVNFSNLQNAANVSYMLTYQTDTQEEGAMGALKLNSQQSDSLELLFGTCSKNVCRYHTGIHNARLEVSYTSKSGKKYLKKYKIKI